MNSFKEWSSNPKFENMIYKNVYSFWAVAVKENPSVENLELETKKKVAKTIFENFHLKFIFLDSKTTYFGYFR